MYPEIERFWHAFIPLMVALDGIGLLPVFWGLTHRLDASQRQRAATEAASTALLVTLGFLLVSRFIFSLMGLRAADLMIAGGTILMCLSLRDLLIPETAPHGLYASPGIVPVGVPLLAGPAVLAAVVLVRDRYGWGLTLAALASNLAIVWIILRLSSWLIRGLGQEGSQVISKIANLVLAAFAVMLIREGITALIVVEPIGRM